MILRETEFRASKSSDLVGGNRTPPAELTKAGCAWDAKKEKCADCAKQKKSKKCKKAGCKWKKSEEKCLAKK